MLQLHKLVINVGKLAEGYKKAGQFVQIKVGDSKPGFFAIASPPNSSSDGLIEVLIKDGSPGTAASLLCQGPQGMRPIFGPVSAVHSLALHVCITNPVMLHQHSTIKELCSHNRYTVCISLGSPVFNARSAECDSMLEENSLPRHSLPNLGSSNTSPHCARFTYLLQ